jgi:hypothetical protein
MLLLTKEWGTFRGANDNFLIFEDRQGTTRMAYIQSGMQKFTEIVRK